MVKGSVASAPASLSTRAAATHSSFKLFASPTDDTASITQKPTVSTVVGTGVG
jgi:hypothetical protein